MTVFKNLLTKRVPQILGIYFGAAWALIEFVDWLVARYQLSGYFTDIILVIFVSLIPTVFILAYFHGTPGRDKWTKFEKISIPINLSITIALIAFIPRDENFSSSATVPSDGGRKMIVVLPFENMGPTEDVYFADGITEEITARLAGIRGLGVIARTSANQYKNTDKSVKQIGKELNVEYLLEGSVRWQRLPDGSSRVRVTPRLSRVSDATQLWASIYDELLSEVFRVQSEIAERVVGALGIALLEPERKLIESKPTENLRSYDYYLRGNYYYNRSFTEADLNIAIQMYEKATEIDTNFSKAYARLSEVHSRAYWYHYDRTQNRLARAKRAVDKAFDVTPELDEAHVALGYYYYWGHLDYTRALEQFNIAKEDQPNNGDLLAGIGYVQRRQGNFKQAITSINKAFDLDPMSANLAFHLGETYELLRSYPDAENYYNQALSIRPDVVSFYVNKSNLYLRWKGNPDLAQSVLDEGARNSGFAENEFIITSSIFIDLINKDYPGALRRLAVLPNQTFDWQWSFKHRTQLLAEIYDLMDNKQLAMVYYDSARVILEELIQKRPTDARLHSSLGIVNAGLGKKSVAIREGKLGVELLPVTKEAWAGLYRIEDLARIYVMVGEYALAIEQLAFLLSRPGLMSEAILKLDPTWHPLHNHESYKKLIGNQT